MAWTSVCVERHLDSWERFLAVNQWNLQGVGQMLGSQSVWQLGARASLWDALLAAVETPLVAKVRGQRLGVQTGHDHSDHQARGALWVGRSRELRRGVLQRIPALSTRHVDR
jgi:hypothetical protein